jgi:UDP-glucose 4-epimerase
VAAYRRGNINTTRGGTVRIAVTGGSGFIGRAVVTWAEGLGHTAYPFDRSTGDDVLGDLGNLKGADAVIHLAGMLGTSELFAEAEAAVQANVVGTLRVLEFCAQNDARYVGITMPDSSWANVYQATKLCANRFATAWHRSRGVPVSHVRAFNAYGPGQKHGPGHPQKILPTFATRAWAGLPLQVWGDGTQTVDLVHADDVARVLVAALAFGDDEIIDAGTGVAVTVNDVADFVNAFTGNKAGVEHLPMRPGETPNTSIISRGEGWHLLDGWRPGFFWARLVPTVESYRPGER